MPLLFICTSSPDSKYKSHGLNKPTFGFHFNSAHLLQCAVKEFADTCKIFKHMEVVLKVGFSQKASCTINQHFRECATVMYLTCIDKQTSPLPLSPCSSLNIYLQTPLKERHILTRSMVTKPSALAKIEICCTLRRCLAQALNREQNFVNQRAATDLIIIHP
jgi:hypothetical protein